LKEFGEMESHYKQTAADRRKSRLKDISPDIVLGIELRPRPELVSISLRHCFGELQVADAPKPALWRRRVEPGLEWQFALARGWLGFLKPG